jgi:CHAD domain-containing protein
MKSGYLAFTSNGSVDFDRLLEKIHRLFPVQKEAVLHVDEQYLDTFDWRMYNSGFVFRQTGTRYLLTSLSGMPVLEIPGPKKPKLFWRDFPEGVLRDRLAPISDNRALCPVLRVVGLRRNFRLYNRDEKVVLRFSLDTGEVFADDKGRGPFTPYLRLEGVRGYQKPLRRVAELLQRNNWQELKTGENFFDLTLRVIDRQPIDHKQKTSVYIQPEQTMNQAISTIGLTLHTAMERNLPGVLGDIDAEFLHDFRVALRRTRSVLSQLKNEIPPGQAGVFQEEFKWLGSVTGPVRDLDVCLQKADIYRGFLSERLHQGLVQLLEEIQQQRTAQFIKMQENLQATRAVNLLANWHEFLTALPADIEWPAGQVLCPQVAVKVVRRCFRRLIRDASAIIEGEHGDSAIHKLRIQAKKFRYMSEFFRRFFPADDMDLLLKELHGLQDDLGDFNDLAVQIRGFQQRRAILHPDMTIRDTLEGLLAGLAAEKKKILKRCVKRCAAFMDQSRIQLFGEGIKKK